MNDEVYEIEKIAYLLRLKTLKAIYNSNYGFLGSCFSSADIVATLGYLNCTRSFDKISNSVFVLSKGHIAPMLYSALEYFQGIKMKDDEYGKYMSKFQAHPNTLFLNEAIVSSGSLGMGISVATGIAYGLRMSKINKRVYVLLGDGEIQEGIVWETIFAITRQYNPLRITILIDANNMQSVGKVNNSAVMKEALKSLKLNFYEIDGNNISEVRDAILKANDDEGTNIIWSNTKRGYGIAEYDDTVRMSRKPTEEEYIKWCDNLERKVR